MATFPAEELSMISGARFVRMPDGKRVLQLYSQEWWTPNTIDWDKLPEVEQREILKKGFTVDGRIVQ